MKKELLLSSLLCLGFMTNCSTTQKEEEQKEEQKEEPTQEQVVDIVEEFNRFAAENPVYFSFDSSKTNDKKLAKTYEEQLNNIKWLEDAVKLTVNGYCDNVGSVAYNRALGKRRAEAVQKVLKKKVKNDVQIDVVSYGKDRYAKYVDDLKENNMMNRKVEIVATK